MNSNAIIWILSSWKVIGIMLEPKVLALVKLSMDVCSHVMFCEVMHSQVESCSRGKLVEIYRGRLGVQIFT